MSEGALRVIDAGDRDEPRASVPFWQSLQQSGLWPLKARRLSVLQVNVGKRCNQACDHCHVDAGPDRTEVMPDEVVDAILSVLERANIPTLDITGGAPELHPRFRDLVEGADSVRRRVLHRCNLTVLNTPRYAELVPFLADRDVEIICSLPSTNPRQTDAQRGRGVFEKSIAGLRLLNEHGFGTGRRKLALVTNPTGAFLPAGQSTLEAAWKRDLDRRWGVRFDSLYTITNMPMARFLDFLRESGNEGHYMNKLVNAYNPLAAAEVMCRDMISVSWDGRLYDCDFNQMLELELVEGQPRTIFDFDRSLLEGRDVAVADHCYGCTAGAGSSCGGEVV